MEELPDIDKIEAMIKQFGYGGGVLKIKLLLLVQMSSFPLKTDSWVELFNVVQWSLVYQDSSAEQSQF